MTQRLERGAEGETSPGIVVSGVDVPVDSGASSDRPERQGVDGSGVRRRAIWLPMLVVALVLSVIGLTSDPGAEPTTRAPGALGAPSEPPGAQPPPEPAAGTRQLPALAMGWRSMELPGWGPEMDVGESGWLIGIYGGPGIIALTSTNGLDWRPRTLPISGWEIAVHSGTTGMWVAALGPEPGSGTTTYRSVNGGGTWTRVGLLGDEPWVVGMEEAGGELYAFGKTGSRDPWTEGAPALWQFDNGEWQALPLEGDRGWVAGVVSWQGVTYALGSDDNHPAVWALSGGEKLGIDAPGGGFIAARVHDNRLWAITSVDVWTNGAVVVSDDLEVWTPLKVTGGTRLEVVGGDLAVVHDAEFTLLSESPIRVHSGQGSDPDTGWRDIAYLTGIGSALNTTAMVGDSLLGGSRFYLRMSWPADDPVAGPRMVFDQSDIAWQGRWILPASATEWGPLGPFVEWDGSFYTLNHGTLAVMRFRIGDIAPTIEWEEVATLTRTDGWADFMVTEEGLYLTTASGLYRVDEDGVENTDLPVGGPARVATIEGRLMVVTSNNVLWSRQGGDWTSLGRVEASILGSIPGAFVASTDAGWGITTNGDDVQPEPGLRGWWVGSPFILGEVSEGITSVTLIDRWPERRELEIPTIAEVVDVRWSGSRIVARTPLEVLISDDGGDTWEVIPAAIENGVPRDAHLIPSNPPLMYGLLDGGDQALYLAG